MKSKAYGWLAAGVLAAGLNAMYHDGGLQWLHRAADQVEYNSAAVLALATGRADQFLTEARLATPRDQAASCRWATTMARLQSKFARSGNRSAQMEAFSARREAQLARMEAQREAGLARIEAQRVRIEALVAARTARMHAQDAAFSPVSFDTVGIRDICPRIRVNIPRVRVADGMVDVENSDIDTPVVETPSDSDPI
jgi:hypothetical protein